MARDTALLTDEFRPQVHELLERLRQQGWVLVPFFTLRTPWEQARLWRQSRARSTIERHVASLRQLGAPHLAGVIESVGPQHGRWATNAKPGRSWHQWGEGLDCFVEVDGDAVWRADHPGYRAYAEEARRMGLTAGFFWQQQDSVHIQLRAGRVRDRFTWPQIDQQMLERFGRFEHQAAA